MLNKLHCWIFGHQYEVWQVFSKVSRRVVCDRCGGDWGMHDEVRCFLRWDQGFDRFYQAMGHRVRPHASALQREVGGK